MSRYIEFNDAVKVMACEMYAEAQSQGYDVDDIEDFMPEATAWLNDAPSIDIVRCKECKYSEYREDFEDYECHSSGCGLVYDADFFCADGERREP